MLSSNREGTLVIMNDNKLYLGNNVVDFKKVASECQIGEIVYACDNCDSQLFFYTKEGLECSECECFVEGTEVLKEKE